uniref:Uncharacterized protein n=1 Tax=Anguilla anguilla TaxID=7936 RepID=A0A0E9WHY6_ANGAN
MTGKYACSPNMVLSLHLFKKSAVNSKSTSQKKSRELWEKWEEPMCRASPPRKGAFYRLDCNICPRILPVVLCHQLSVSDCLCPPTLAFGLILSTKQQDQQLHSLLGGKAYLLKVGHKADEDLIPSREWNQDVDPRQTGSQV